MRAKFHCWTVEELEYGGQEVTLGAVISDDNMENQDFNQATPSGELKMIIDNPAAKEFFKSGIEYYLDFTPANKE